MAVGGFLSSPEISMHDVIAATDTDDSSLTKAAHGLLKDPYLNMRVKIL